MVAETPTMASTLGPNPPDTGHTGSSPPPNVEHKSAPMQKPTPLPLLISHLVTPTDIATKVETLCPDDRSTVVQTFLPIGVSVTEI